tara:strand:+ start:75 stop:1058 length:984 start_codon:yes stop_codon:yes gene_type:complete
VTDFYDRVNDLINQKNILTTESFFMRPVGTSSIQCAGFPGLGQNNFKKNGVTNTTVATKAAVINKFEETFVQAPGQLIDELSGLPYLAVELQHPEYQFTTTSTTFELPHRIGSGVFAINQSRGDNWDFERLLLEKMKEVGPYNAIAFYDPISAILGSFLSHYKSIPSQWSKVTGAVIGGCVAINTQPVISAGVTQDPLGANKEEHLVLDASEKGKASSAGLGNIIHLENDIDAEHILLHLYLNQSRLKFYKPEIRKLLTTIYQYGALNLMSDGIDFRNRCYLKPLKEVEFDRDKLAKEIKKQINECRKKELISIEPLTRTLPIAYNK